MLVLDSRRFGRFGIVAVLWVGWVILKKSLGLLCFSAASALVGTSLVLTSLLTVALWLSKSLSNGGKCLYLMVDEMHKLSYFSVLPVFVCHLVNHVQRKSNSMSKSKN
jgi:hypothetical protein